MRKWCLAVFLILVVVILQVHCRGGGGSRGGSRGGGFRSGSKGGGKKSGFKTKLKKAAVIGAVAYGSYQV